MSLNFPRHVKDLPKLELDSDDELCTPHKIKNKNEDLNQRLCESNKENDEKYYNNHGLTKPGISLRMLPKRRAELPTLESDSEEDDLDKKDNLNCAILNDSFLGSPSKSDKEDVCSKEFLDIKTNDTSLLHHFNNMGLNSSAQEQSEDSHKFVESIDLTKKKAGFNNILISHNKTSTTADTLFSTPQIRSFSVQSRPRDLCATKSQKNKSAIVNEFRTQKVLFQTPMSIARAPVMQNDSISLSLCDTINESAVPSVDNISQCARYKKSLDGDFIAAGEELQEKILQDTSKNLQLITKDQSPIIDINKSSYLIVDKLGCGGSSSVYLAKRRDNGKECALKVVDLQGDPAVVEGYFNETKLLAKLQGNICVVSLYEYQLLQKESKLFLVMEKGDSDLHKILQSYKTNLPLYVLTNFLYQILQAVNYIHQNGVIHSDLKPANFLMVNGRLKLIDFGIASNISIDSTSIIKFSQAGTFNYISPEALTDTSTGGSPMRSTQPKIKISTKSDVWSLGCILYLFLYQKTPFGHIKNIYTKISAICSPTQTIEYGPLPTYYPTMLVHMAKNCLQHNPKQRPSCAELLKYPFNMLIPIQNLSLPTN